MKSIATHFYCGATETESANHKKKFNIPQEIYSKKSQKFFCEIQKMIWPSIEVQIGRHLYAIWTFYKDLLKQEPGLREKVAEKEENLIS
jgi:hypothetical protein